MSIKSKVFKTWHEISCTRANLNLQKTLKCGQTFTWKETGDEIWTNVINNTIFSIAQDDSKLFWCTHVDDEHVVDQSIDQHTLDSISSHKSQSIRKRGRKRNTKSIPTEQDCSPPVKAVRQCGDAHAVTAISSINDDKKSVKSIEQESDIRDYFQLDIDLVEMYKQWADVDPNFAKISQTFTGIRILRQDPIENLFSFICSSNNNISRITMMVNSLCKEYGKKIGTVNGIPFYTFPTAESLSQPGVEDALRKLGFGYRAKFIANTAKILQHERPCSWLETLRKHDYEYCIEELMKLSGVGRKVADCIALMSLDKAHAVPVDTHVLQIAIRDYTIPGVNKDLKSLTPAIHNRIGKFFYDLYGPYAGWAHTVLFAADLRQPTTKPSSKKKSSKNKVT